MTPTPKVAAGGVAGAVTILLMAVLGKFGVEFDAVEASAITTLFAFGAGWLKREKGIDLDNPDV